MDINTTPDLPELKRNPKYKECRTENAVYFLGGPFSQWSRHGFKAELNGKMYNFACAEQYMMAAKAAVFSDQEILEQIMKTSAPDEIKALGRKVKNFDPVIWSAKNEEIVFQGNMAKFTQNPELKKYLLDTGSMLLVEGASYDKVWGVGLAFDDPAILDESKWRGENRLGKALMRTRTEISKLS